MAHQFCQVSISGVVGYAAHGYGLAARGTTGCQGNVEKFGGALGVSVEHLVKVTHAVEQYLMGVFGLDAQELLHHGRMAIG